jgi:transposase
MNQAEFSAYCRSKGLYPEHIDAWLTQCRQANAVLSTQADRKKFNEQIKEIHQLKSELNRKDKALAEAATLLILKKSSSNLGGCKGRLTPLVDRHTVFGSVRLCVHH